MSNEVDKFNTLLDEFLEKLIVQFDNNKLRTYRKWKMKYEEEKHIALINKR